MSKLSGTRSFIGIDPGHSGGVALVTRGQYEATTHTWAFKPMTLRDMWIVLGGCISNPCSGLIVYLEHVHAMPKQGVSSTFKFGRHYGNIEAFLTACQMPFNRVNPAEWQRPLGLIRRKGETPAQKKNRHKALAEELFPEVKRVTHANADALLIAEYGRRINATD